MDAQSQKPRKRPSKIEEMSKEQIRQAILKKRECNARAQNIVECLLEKNVTEEFFMKCLPDINQSHFDDVIEERSIVHLCGYPLCNTALSQIDIPKQKYRISLKTNKVYDITTRKNFCSNCCYKSAMHVKKQMLTSPLWFREYEDTPKFSLLPMNSLGSLGQEIDLNITEKVAVKQETLMYTSINDFTSASLNEISGDKPLNSNSLNKENIGSDNENAVKTSNSENMNNFVCRNINQETSSTEYIGENKQKRVDSQPENVGPQLNPDISVTSKVQSKKPIRNPLNIVGDIIEKSERKIDPILTQQPDADANSTQTDTKKRQPSQKNQHSITAITIEVEKCLAEWFTLDTLLYLFGDEKVKEMVAGKGECIQEYLNNYSKSVFYTSNSYDQYQALCRKLNMLELEDRKYDAQTLQKDTKPLPDYSVLQEESKKLQLKVKAFMAGETEIVEPQSEMENNTEKSENSTQLPMVDKNARNALRRRIVCQHLNKVLPDLWKSLNLSSLTVGADIRLLVNTFKLQAHNIMFKPIQWTLIAIVFIKLLSIRDKRLEYLLQQPVAYRHLQLLLLSYKQEGGYLDRLISWMTDIDRMLDVNETQLTIE